MSEEVTTFDPSRFIADMCAPLDKDKNYWTWATCHKAIFYNDILPNFGPEPQNDDESKITITPRVLHIMLEGGSIKEGDDFILERTRYGWLVGYLFGFFLRGELFYKDLKLSDKKGEVFTLNKFKVMCPKLFQGKKLSKMPQVDADGAPIKGKGLEYVTAPKYVTFVKENLWASAHLWAAFFGLDGIHRFNPSYDELTDISFPNEWPDFIRRAETLRRFGIAHGIFKKIAGKKHYDESKIIAYPEIGFEPRINLVGLSQAEWDELQIYQSDMSFNRLKNSLSLETPK